MKTIVISASTSNYFSLLDGLLSSVESSAKSDRIDIGVLDLGLDESQRESLKQRDVITKIPPWDYPLANFAEPPPVFFKAMTARPHLPKHFPGYDLYFWLDADCWVQEWDAATLYLSAASNSGFACTPECDRSYLAFYKTTSVLNFAYNCFRSVVDEKSAQSLAHFPIINTGAFAARANAPHWEKWSAVLGEALVKLTKPNFFIEQTALNVVARAGGGIATAFLPSICNWMCNLAMPRCTPDGSKLIDPQPPHEPLGILHLTSDTKNGDWPVRDTVGNTHARSLRFKKSIGSTSE